MYSAYSLATCLCLNAKPTIRKHENTMNERKISGAKLKSLRKAHDYTQDYVASRLGVARQTYSHYENGRRIPSYDVVAKIAALYKISMDDLGISFEDNTMSDSRSHEKGCSRSEEIQGFLDFCNDSSNSLKIRFLNQKEKEMLYYFENIDDSYKWELLEFAKILARKN